MRLLRIGDVSREVGVPEHVIRFWCDEAFPQNFAQVQRSPKGARMFSPSQVKRLKEVRRLLHVELYTIEGAKRQLRLAAEARALAKSGTDTTAA